jgi:hypothetical protein
MRKVSIIALVGGTALLGGGDGAVAADLVWERQDPDHYLMFSGIDLWRSGAFLHGGFVWSPTGLDRSGFIVKVVSGAGAYRYRSGTSTFVGIQRMVAAMPGWRFKSPALEVSVFGGPDSQVHVMVPDDVGHPLRGMHMGFRGGVDLWWEPTPERMVAASLSFASVGPNLWTRVATGWKVADWFYVGPETIAIATTDYRQLRIGAHATAIKYGPYEWSAGIGWAFDTDTTSGLYGRFDFLTRLE